MIFIFILWHLFTSPTIFVLHLVLCGRWESYPREFAKCRRCRKAKYCGKECQSTAWSEGHRFWCSARDGDDEAHAHGGGGGGHTRHAIVGEHIGREHVTTLVGMANTLTTTTTTIATVNPAPATPAAETAGGGAGGSGGVGTSPTTLTVASASGSPSTSSSSVRPIANDSYSHSHHPVSPSSFDSRPHSDSDLRSASRSRVHFRVHAHVQPHIRGHASRHLHHHHHHHNHEHEHHYGHSHHASHPPRHRSHRRAAVVPDDAADAAGVLSSSSASNLNLVEQNNDGTSVPTNTSDMASDRDREDGYGTVINAGGQRSGMQDAGERHRNMTRSMISNNGNIYGFHDLFHRVGQSEPRPARSEISNNDNTGNDNTQTQFRRRRQQQSHVGETSNSISPPTLEGELPSIPRTQRREYHRGQDHAIAMHAANIAPLVLNQHRQTEIADEQHDEEGLLASPTAGPAHQQPLTPPRPRQQDIFRRPYGPAALPPLLPLPPLPPHVQLEPGSRSAAPSININLESNEPTLGITARNRRSMPPTAAILALGLGGDVNDSNSTGLFTSLAGPIQGHVAAPQAVDDGAMLG